MASHHRVPAALSALLLAFLAPMFVAKVEAQPNHPQAALPAGSAITPDVLVASIGGSIELLATKESRPAVLTEPASGVTTSEATLNALVNPHGTLLACEFEYGTTTSYGSEVPCSSLPSPGTTQVAVSAIIAGLMSATTYDYRIVGTNARGTSKGSNEKFKTQAAEPEGIANWQQAILELRVPGEGCFTANYPAVRWNKARCSPRRAVPQLPALTGHPKIGGNAHYPAVTSKTPTQTVGGGRRNYALEATSGVISSAKGWFPAISPSTKETLACHQSLCSFYPTAITNSYSLQLNSEPFRNSMTNSLCGAGCQGWAQFVYATPLNTSQGDFPEGISIWSWLLKDPALSCPSGWETVPGWTPGTPVEKCFIKSNVSSLPGGVPNVADLTTDDVTLQANASTSGDEAKMVVSGHATATSQDNLLNLAGSWKAAEFGIFGDGDSSEAEFTNGTLLETALAIEPSTLMPSCVLKSFTGETNNLNLEPVPVLSDGGTTLVSDLNSTPPTQEPQSCAPLPQLEANFPNGTFGLPYPQSGGFAGFQVTPGTGVAPFTWTWSPSSASLPPGSEPATPPGLFLTASGSQDHEAVISGTPTQAGNYCFTVEVEDALGERATENDCMRIERAPVTLTLTDSPTYASPVGSPIQLTATVTSPATIPPSPDGGTIEFEECPKYVPCDLTSLGSASAQSGAGVKTWDTTGKSSGYYRLVANYTEATNYDYLPATAEITHVLYVSGQPLFRNVAECGGGVTVDWFGPPGPAVPNDGDNMHFTFQTGSSPFYESGYPDDTWLPEGAAVEDVEAVWNDIGTTNATGHLTVEDVVSGSAIKASENPYTVGPGFSGPCPPPALQEPPKLPNIEAPLEGQGVISINPFVGVDPEGNNIYPPTLEVEQQPQHGTVKVVDGGSCEACAGPPTEFQYVPNSPREPSADSFTFRVSTVGEDKQTSNTATATIIPGN